VLTRKDFMGNHEWCFYGWREGAAHRFYGPANATDVWSVRKVNPQSMVHLTEKPVELAVRALQYSSRAGEHVLDLLAGSGSTLIAAQQTGRRAFLLEIDPLLRRDRETLGAVHGQEAVLPDALSYEPGKKPGKVAHSCFEIGLCIHTEWIVEEGSRQHFSCCLD
jgi:hypothetical protein